jgi:hypothetical protein
MIAASCASRLQRPSTTSCSVASSAGRFGTGYSPGSTSRFLLPAATWTSSFGGAGPDCGYRGWAKGIWLTRRAHLLVALERAQRENFQRWSFFSRRPRHQHLPGGRALDAVRLCLSIVPPCHDVILPFLSACVRHAFVWFWAPLRALVFFVSVYFLSMKYVL